MVKVEAGRFIMGSDIIEEENPLRQIDVKGEFYIMQFLVSQEFWFAIMGNNPSQNKDFSYPVTNISWIDIRNSKGFVDKLNKIIGNSKKGKRFHLPSEAQWEYAAKGGKDANEQYRFPGTDRFEDCKQIFGLRSLGLGLPNSLGIYDLAGTVWQWCEDDWVEAQNQRFLKMNSEIPFKHKPFRGKLRIFRGGSSISKEEDCTTSKRASFYPQIGNLFQGFRLVYY
jgi:formylglycine-generating enzyme required for sulfatase activity